jgi:hypothetical protein
MFKRRILHCPGCDDGFYMGRSMSQHLIRSPGCKAFIMARRTTGNDQVAISGPHAPIPDVDDGRSTAESDNGQAFDGHSEAVSGEESIIAEEDQVPVEPDTCSPNLQDVVSFPVAYASSAYHEVQLLKLLHDVGAPNYAFQSFMEWGRNCTRDEYHFQPCPQRYESQIQNLTELVGMRDCRPKTIPVSLAPDNLTLDVVVFPFATMLASLLNCPILNKIENLVVNPLDRFGRYRSPDGRLDEVNSGQWYQDTYDQTIHDGDKEFLAPIIFTMDKTVISEASHLSVYVILFTTSIFNREVSTVHTFNCICSFLTLFPHPFSL